jgi:hypothetical protein
MVAFENDVLRVLYLAQIIVSAQVNALSFMRGELRSRHLVNDVEIQMGITRALRCHDAPVRILNGELRLHDPETRPLLHALEHVIYSRPALTLHALTHRCKIILLAHVLLSPAYWDVVVICVSVDPTYILIGSSP